MPRVGIDVPDRIEIDGRAATADALWGAVFGSGHFTAMQVRGGRTRGLHLHLRRLDEATRELYDVGLDPAHVRELIRHALTERSDASVRVYVFRRWDDPSVIVTVREPAGVAATPQRLEPIEYRRPLPHIKHVGGFRELDHTSLALQHGFDGSLLIGPDGEISEAGIANIGFLDGSTVVWPDGPQLQGITMQLLERALDDAGTPSRRARVLVGDVGAYGGAFVCNARGIAPVGAIGDRTMPVDDERMTALFQLHASVPWDEI